MELLLKIVCRFTVCSPAYYHTARCFVCNDARYDVTDNKL